MTFDTTSGMSMDAEGDFIFQPRPGETNMPIRNPGPGATRGRSEQWVQQFIPLIPQFTWVSGYAGATHVCGGLGRPAVPLAGGAATERAGRPRRSVSTVRAGGLVDEADGGIPADQSGVLRLRHAGSLADHSFLFRLEALPPDPAALPLAALFPFLYFDHLPWGDRWNWFFGLTAIFLAGASTVALIGAIAIRAYLAKPREPGREKDPARWGPVVLVSILFVVLLRNWASRNKVLTSRSLR